MNVGLSQAIGRTPLIELSTLSARIGRRVLGKAEFLNPGGSVKDRAAKWIVDAAEASGALAAGGTIVEGTAGSTGISLALLANERGYRIVIFVPDDQSPEKIALLRTFGADVRVVPALPFTNAQNYYHLARGFAEQTGAVWADQFENTANRQAHIESTGPEIWRQTAGDIDAFVAAAGTGGTLGGTAIALKERKPEVLTVLCDPMGSALFAYVNDGELRAQGESELEGIGIKRITANFAEAPIDRAIQVEDRDAIAMAHWLLAHEGLFVGGSTGLNVVGAARIAMSLPEGSTVVTVLCDGGQRYSSRLFDAGWLREHDLHPAGNDLDFLVR